MSSPSNAATAPEHATWLRRIAALCVDWAASSAVAFAILGNDDWSRSGSWLTLVVFWLESSLGVALAGASFGQALVGIRVHTLERRPLSLLRALQRQLLVCLVIPPLVFRDDGRGLHDLWTRSGAYRVR
jgi:uncharacterized RDD family membrane protein YckC